MRISGGQELHAIDAVIPGDISSAAFFLCAAGLFPRDTEANRLKPADESDACRLLDILILMGIGISVYAVGRNSMESCGARVQVEVRALKGATLAGAETVPD